MFALLGLSLGFSKQRVLAIGNEAWGDYRIAKVQSRSQL